MEEREKSEAESVAVISRSWIEGIWKASEKDDAVGRIHPDCEFLGWGKGVEGKAGWTRTVARFEEAFGSILVSVVDLVESEGNVAGHARFAARHLASGREVDVFFSFFLRWEKGLLTWSRSVLDTASLLAQLNLLDLKRWDIVLDPLYSASDDGPCGEGP